MRKFKLRNGAIVEEHNSNNHEYTMLTGIEGVNPVGGLLCLLPSHTGEFSRGGAWGKGFDIVEEITEEESDSETL